MRVARVEEIGPMLLEELAGLLGHARVTLVPVVDLATSVSVNGYEHPQAVKDRTHLRTVGDVFPHAATISRKTDMDHPAPYDPTGPPGQTGDHNAAPLGRRHHRAKTHLPLPVPAARPGPLPVAKSPRTQPPRRRHRHPRARPAQAIELAHPGVLDAALDRIEASLRTDQ